MELEFVTNFKLGSLQALLQQNNRAITCATFWQVIAAMIHFRFS